MSKPAESRQQDDLKRLHKRIMRLGTRVHVEAACEQVTQHLRASARLGELWRKYEQS